MDQSSRIDSPNSRDEISLADLVKKLGEELQKVIDNFHQQPVSPRSAYDLEKALKTASDETMRQLLEQELNRCEPDAKEDMPNRIRYHRNIYRINKKTPAQLATSFGPIVLRSFLYLNLEAGEKGVHPLHLQLGIVAGAATSVLAERVARWAVDYSQKEVRQLLCSEHGVKWSNDRLRRVLRDFRRLVVKLRAEVQVERLLQWLGEAEKTRGRHRPVLAVGRDGIMVPIRGQGYKEASTATVSVSDRRGRRLGTIYLGQMPESKQATLSQELTALVETVLQQWSGSQPRLVFVTDKGKVPEAYYRTVLRRMKDPRQPQRCLAWEWVLDFYHVCAYLNHMREGLFGKKQKGYRWYQQMRHWLRYREQGVTQVLRSALQYFNQRDLGKAARRKFWKGYTYLRKHSEWMDYQRYHRLGLPLGSGVTEAACKTVFGQRLKRSGMRWHKKSGQVIVELRVIYLSGIWEEVSRRSLQTRRLPKSISRPKKTCGKKKIAA